MYICTPDCAGVHAKEHTCGIFQPVCTCAYTLYIHEHVSVPVYTIYLPLALKVGVEPHFCVVTNPHCKLHRYTWSVSNSEIEWQRSVSNSEIEWQRKQVILAISRPVSPILLRPPPLQDVWPQCVYTLCVGLSNVFLDLLLWLTAQLIVQLTYDSSQLPNLFVCEHTHTLPSTYTPSVVLVCFPASFSTPLSSSHNLKITPFPCVWHMDRKDQTHTHTHTHTHQHTWLRCCCGFWQC